MGGDGEFFSVGECDGQKTIDGEQKQKYISQEESTTLHEGRQGSKENVEVL
ncbi:hypothetical protein OsI_02548 [Oryza sativa Indica Group]|uniref:Uncharacterized protein n=1 Tax=Oryza sativa subsp. indica TaxID=39946 RepID=A2WRR0_ORYSI|nr:hypothetical protein OsI_02548 [Oryza sativa Indica Group]